MTTRYSPGYLSLCMHCYANNSLEHVEKALAENVYGDGTPNYPGAFGSARQALRVFLRPDILWHVCRNHRRELAAARKQHDEDRTATQQRRADRQRELDEASGKRT